MYQLGGSAEKGQSTLYITGPSSGSGDEEQSDFRIVVRQWAFKEGAAGRIIAPELEAFCARILA
ncbi:hypothetical protein D3C77_446920 [compost metagenome]|jgi:hypothetical protein